MEKGPLALKYPHHVSAKRLRESEDHDEENDDVQNSKRGHFCSSFRYTTPESPPHWGGDQGVFSKAFRTKQGVKQVNE
jgi:hypothetical protein